MHLQHLIWVLALVAAVVGYGASTGRVQKRFLLGLWLGVVFAHAGWGLLNLPSVLVDPSRVLHPGALSVLFVPLGVLLVAPWRESLAALPLPLAIARVGCLPYGCCYDAWWTALPEVAGLVSLHLAARRWPQHSSVIVLSGFGAIRLMSLPLRTGSGVEPFVDPAWVALAWMLAGLLLRSRIGSAETASDWFSERTQPLLRALALMLSVWLLFPLGAELFRDPSNGRLAASVAALVLLLALRRPGTLRISAASAGAFGAALLVGLLVSAVASEALLAIGAARSGGLRTALALVVIAPIFEEVLYRERLLGALRSLWGWPAALLASSALFAMGHMDARVMPIAFAGGIVCGAVVLRTGCLATAIGLHAGWNLGVVSGG